MDAVTKTEPDEGSDEEHHKDEALHTYKARAQIQLQKGLDTLRASYRINERTKYEDVIRFCEEAGDLFVIEGIWRQAGVAYTKCAQASLALNRYRDSAAFLVQAARVMQKVDPEESIQLYNEATQQYASVGYWQKCAAMQVTVGGMYEKDGALEDAAEAFRAAADYFVSVSLFPQAVRCLVQAGGLLADEDIYEGAVELFDAAVTHSLDHNLLKLNAPHLILGAAYRQVDDYSDVDFAFAASRERRFLLDIMECAKFYDLDEYIDHCWNFDYVVELKPYQLRMLERIYLIIEAGAPEVRALKKKRIATPDGKGK